MLDLLGEIALHLVAGEDLDRLREAGAVVGDRALRAGALERHLHAAALGPRGLALAEGAAGVLQDRKDVVLAVRVVVQGRRVAEHLGRVSLRMWLNTAIRWQPMSISAPPPDSAFFQNQGECGPKWASRPRTHKGRPMVPAATMTGISRKSGE